MSLEHQSGIILIQPSHNTFFLKKKSPANFEIATPRCFPGHETSRKKKPPAVQMPTTALLMSALSDMSKSKTTTFSSDKTSSETTPPDVPRPDAESPPLPGTNPVAIANAYLDRYVLLRKRAPASTTTTTTTVFVQNYVALVCCICSFSTQTRVNMGRHVSRNHRDLDKKVLMERIMSGTGSTQNGEERGGNDTSAPESDPLVCYICGFSTAEEADMKRHVHVLHRASGKHTVMANIVNAAILYGGTEIDTNGAPLGCSSCRFSTVRGYNLRCHIAQIHPDAPAQGVVVAASMIGHTEPAAEEVPLRCDLCSFKTARRVYMRKHIWRCHVDVDRVAVLERIVLAGVYRAAGRT